MVEMSFEDNGCGMSEAELDTLFQDFEQVLDDDENQATGLYEENEKPRIEPVSLGLGLAVTARFVRLNLGQIAIGSEKGKGTKVSMKIPFRKARQDPLKMPMPERNTLTSLPTPPLQIPDHSLASVNHFSELPGLLERSASADTVLRTRNRPTLSKDDLAANPVPDVSASVANAAAFSSPIMYSTASSYPFPAVGAARLRVSVLVAEDNPLNSRLLETRLAKRGHDVKVTVDGQACLEAFQLNSAAYDVILMDIKVRNDQHFASKQMPVRRRY